MTVEQLVNKYIDAWSRGDAAGVLELMHSGAAYYDAFWMETCVGPHLRDYFEDTMREEPYRFERVGDLIVTPGSCVVRYRAFNRFDTSGEVPIYEGAEILTLRDGRILTVSDFYFNSRQEVLEELAHLVSKRHGLPAFADSGLSALKALRIKNKLTDGLEKERLYLDPDITASQIADFLGCTLEQLSVFIAKEFGTDVDGLLDARRVDCAKQLLRHGGGNAGVFKAVADHCGFKTQRAFVDAFTAVVGMSPIEYCTAPEPESEPATSRPAC